MQKIVPHLYWHLVDDDRGFCIHIVCVALYTLEQDLPLNDLIAWSYIERWHAVSCRAHHLRNLHELNVLKKISFEYFGKCSIGGKQHAAERGQPGQIDAANVQ